MFINHFPVYFYRIKCVTADCIQLLLCFNSFFIECTFNSTFIRTPVNIRGYYMNPKTMFSSSLMFRNFSRNAILNRFFPALPRSLPALFMSLTSCNLVALTLLLLLLVLRPSFALCSNLRARPRRRKHSRWRLGPTQLKGGAPELKQRGVRCWCVAHFKKWARKAAGVWYGGRREQRSLGTSVRSRSKWLGRASAGFFSLLFNEIIKYLYLSCLITTARISAWRWSCHR